MRKINKLFYGSMTGFIIGGVLSGLKKKRPDVYMNAPTHFNVISDVPTINRCSFIHPSATIIGQVTVEKGVHVTPHASIRGDEGLNIYIGQDSNVQDGVVIHGMQNFEQGRQTGKNTVFVSDNTFSVYIGEHVSLAPQCQIHGPARIDRNVYIGMQALVHDAYVQENAVIEPGAKIIGVTIPSNRYVSAGKIVTTQEDADRLPEISTEYIYADLNEKTINVNRDLVNGYRGNR